MAFPKCGQGKESGEGGKEGRERNLSLSSYEATNPIGLGPHPYDLISPLFLPNTPFSKYSDIGGGHLHRNFGVTHFSPQHQYY